MQHFSITDINPAMAHARRVIGAFEEHQITGFGRTDRRTDVIEPLGSQPAHIPAGVIDNPKVYTDERSETSAEVSLFL